MSDVDIIGVNLGLEASEVMREVALNSDGTLTYEDFMRLMEDKPLGSKSGEDTGGESDDALSPLPSRPVATMALLAS